MESQGNMNTALKIYASAGDIYSQVRILCYMGEEQKAADLARSGNDKSAFSHLARHYESVGNIQDAVTFFVRANAYSKFTSDFDLFFVHCKILRQRRTFM